MAALRAAYAKVAEMAPSILFGLSGVALAIEIP
jgi:hypothetical protein